MESFMPSCPFRSSNPPEWNPKDPKMWVTQIGCWERLYGKPLLQGDTDYDQCLIDMLILCNKINDTNFNDLIMSLGVVSLPNILNKITSVYCKQSGDEPVIAHDNVINFTYKPEWGIREAWDNYKTLIVRAKALDNCPPSITLATRFLSAIEVSPRLKSLVDNLRFQYRHEKLTWEIIQTEFDMISQTWTESPIHPTPHVKPTNSFHPRLNQEDCVKCGYDHGLSRPCPALTNTCNTCGLMGHFQRKCPTRHSVKSSNQGKPTNEGPLRTRACSNEVAFVYDSGSTSTIFCPSLLDAARDLIPDHQVFYTSSNEPMVSSWRGTVPFTIRTVNGEEKAIELTGSFAPTTTREVLLHSKEAFCSQSRPNEAYVELEGEKVALISRGNSFHADMEIDRSRRTKDSPFMTNSDSGPLAELRDAHQRLGHVGPRGLIDTLLENGLTYKISDAETVCKECLVCKVVKSTITHPKPLIVDPSHHKDMFMVDLKGPLPTPGRKGELYIVVIIQAESRHIQLRPVKQKSDAVNVVGEYVSKFPHLKVMRSDNASELIGNDMQLLLRSRGITQLTSSPYTPQSQGLVERVNRTMMIIINSLLQNLNLDDSFWPWVTVAAQEIYNMRVHSSTSISPNKFLNLPRPLAEALPGDLVSFHLPESEPNTLNKRRIGTYLGSPHGGCCLVMFALSDRWELFPLHPGKVQPLPLREGLRADGQKVYTRSDINELNSMGIQREEEVDMPLDTHLLDGHAADRDHPLPPTSCIPEETDEDEDADGQLMPVTIIKSINGQFACVRGKIKGNGKTNVAWLSKVTEDVFTHSSLGEVAAKDIVEQHEGVFHRTHNTVSINRSRRNVKKSDKEAPAEDVNSGRFIQADDVELSQIVKHKVLIHADVTHPKPIKCRLLRVYKTLEDGTKKAKSRLVVSAWDDAREVPTATTLPGMLQRNLLMLLSSSFNFVGLAMDVKTAFIQTPHHGDVHVELPTLTPEQELKHNLMSKGIYRLSKALYGLKESPRLFQKHLEGLLSVTGWTKWAEGTFLQRDTNGRPTAFLSAYVDDIMIFALNPLVLAQRLQQLIECDDPIMLSLSPVKYIGQLVTMEKGNITLDPSIYLNGLPEFPVKPVVSKGMFGCQLAEGETVNPQLLQESMELTGILGWISMIHPAMSYRFGAMSRYTHQPNVKHISNLQRIIMEVKAQGLSKLLLEPLNVNCPLLRLWVDSSFGDHCGRIGWVIQLVDATTPREYRNNFVAWRSIKDDRLHKSTASSELSAIIDGIQGLTEAYNILSKVPMLGTLRCEVLTDSRVAYIQVNVPESRKDPFTSNRAAFAHQCLVDLNATLHWVEGSSQLADGLTKLFPLNSY